MNSKNLLINDVEHFIGIIHKHLNFLKNDFLEYDSLYKKIICVNILDILSKTINHNHNHRKKFTSFLVKYAPHPIWEKVSLSHLLRLLTYTDNDQFIELSKFVKNRLGTSDSPCEYKAEDIDQDISIIDNLWPKHIKDINKVKLTDLKHKNLFYNYRNYIIHELRRPGGQIDDYLNNTDPFYYGLLDNDNQYLWKLVYPLGFFLYICNTVLEKSKIYYIETNTNPYKILGSSDYLIDILN